MENTVMILCDVGNTSYHFLDDKKDFKKDVKSFEPQDIKERVFYISVNEKIDDKVKNLKNWIDLKPFLLKEKYYETMGTDRMFAVEAISEGIILDAGSAITVDVVKDGSFCGGFIYAGKRAMEQTYAKISPALAYSFNFDLDLDIMPKNSQDAISYGFLKPLYGEVNSHNLPIVLTGGDAKEFKKIFKNAQVDEQLIFKGMKKIIKEAKLC